jgi:hypothetical protein
MKKFNKLYEEIITEGTADKNLIQSLWNWLGSYEVRQHMSNRNRRDMMSDFEDFGVDVDLDDEWDFDPPWDFEHSLMQLSSGDLKKLFKKLGIGDPKDFEFTEDDF